MIKRWALRASAFHFLFHAEGRVTPGRGGSFGTEACAGGRLEWQAWIFATLEGRQGRPGVGLLLGNICLEGVGGRWVLGVRRWMPLPAATTRSPDGILCEAPLYVVLKHPSRWRSDPRRFIFGALGGRQGVGCWALGVRQGRPGGVGCWVLGVGCSIGRRRRGLRTGYFAGRL